MKYTATGLAALSLLFFIGVGCNVVPATNTPDDDAMEHTDTMMDDHSDDAIMMADDAMNDDTMMEEDTMKKEDTMMKEDEMMQDDSTMNTPEDTMMDNMKQVKGSYEAYSPEKLQLAESGDVVLFFHAGWCPTCKALDSDITSHSTNIPDGLTILKTDYDTQTELKKMYGVTYQHTLVQVDAQGNMLKKWSGSPTLSSLVSEVQ